MTARMLGLGQDSLTEIFRRGVFNVIGRNHDDHTKNFGFLMNKQGQWRLAPAFDLTYAFDPNGQWTRGHQIQLSGKQDDFTRQDLLNFAEKCNLARRKAETIIETTLTAFEKFAATAQSFAVDEDLLKTISGNLRLYIGD